MDPMLESPVSTHNDDAISDSATQATLPPTRRAVLAAAAGGAAAIAAALARPTRVEAAAGDPLLIGNTANNAGSANTSLTTNSTGTALLVTQNGSGTALRGSAVGAGSIAGFFTAQNGTGISGVTGNPNSYGVFAQNNGAAGTGGAIRAAGGNNAGVVGTTSNVARYAVVGTNTAATGDGVAGVAGTGGTGVIGFSTGGNGVYGDSDTFGVHGNTTGGTAVRGEATTGIGVWGSSTDDFGVYGTSTNSYAGAFSGPISTTKYLDMPEISVPADPAANSVRIFVRDNASATELCVKIGSTIYVLAPPPLI